MEWISASGEKTVRNCLETGSISGAYDRAFPLSKEERPQTEQKQEAKNSQEDGGPEGQPRSQTASDLATASAAETTANRGSSANAEQPLDKSTSEPPTTTPNGKLIDLPIHPHRGLYFYLHRPRTRTKKPVLVPLPPSASLRAVLQGRTVLEFPSIYILSDSRETLLADKETAAFIIEEEYLRDVEPEDAAEKSAESESETGDGTSGLPGPSIDLQSVDEKKVLEVLKQDLFESVP